MKFVLILFLVLSLSLVAGSGEGSSASDDRIQLAIRNHGKHVTMVLRMAKDGGTIKHVLRPLSFVDSGSTGFVFKGIKLTTNASVSIKFFNKNGADEAKREYKMYSYLDAINNIEVENYGIPTVYYYGRWNGLIVMAYTELEQTLTDHTSSDGYNEYDLLLLIKQFIKQSKYIHSRGVRHDNIKPRKIYTRKCESFLADFDLSSKMAEDNRRSTYFFAPLKYHQGVNRVATDDWESFLYTICETASIPLDWFGRSLLGETGNDDEAASKLYAELKSNRIKILEIIDQSEQGVLKSIIPIIRAFAKEAFSDKPIPDYDGIDDLVTDAMEKHSPEKRCFSWIRRRIMDGSTDDDGLSQEKLQTSIERANTNIRGLVIPEDFREYENFTYPSVDEKFFDEKPNDLWDVDRFRASKFR